MITPIDNVAIAEERIRVDIAISTRLLIKGL